MLLTLYVDIKKWDMRIYSYLLKNQRLILERAWGDGCIGDVLAVQV